MEDWQILLINKNLSLLVKLTKCTSMLLVDLQSEAILSDEDVQQLEALQRNQGNISATIKLYEICRTRKNAYNSLINGLERTRQTGALQILKHGLHEPVASRQSSQNVIHGGVSDWQILYISDNIMQLASLTDCTTRGFIQQLVINEIMTQLECEEVMTACAKEGLILGAMKFYEMVKTRSGGYKALMEGLKATNQVAAWQILQTGMTKHDRSSKEMTDWQKMHIDRKKVELIKTTKLTAKLKTSLSDVFEDDNGQKSRDRIGNDIVKMYETLKSKKDGYAAIIEALLDDNQLDPFNILLEGIAEPLRALSVQVSDKIRPLKDLFPSFSLGNAMEALRRKDLWRDIMKILEDEKNVIFFEEKLPEPHVLYIPRSISNRLLLDAKAFQVKDSDVFVFKDVPINELSRLLHPELVRSSSSQRSYINCRYIYLEDDDDWDEMVQDAASPIHLVQRDEKEFVLVRSTQATDLIRQYSSNKLNHQQAYITENAFINQLKSQTGEKGSLLCDIPGMGKTWLIESLARKLRSQNEKSIVFFIKLSSLGKLLGQLSNVPQKADTLRFLLEYVCTSKLSFDLLWNYAIDNGFELVWFMDGFDEIAHIDVSVTTSFLFDLNAINNVRLILTSRPHMRDHLEKTFQVISYDILPFAREEQISAITSHWVQKYPDGSPNDFFQFANQCIQATKAIQKNNEHDILGVPLKCYILAEVNDKYAKRIAMASGSKPFQIPAEATVRSTCELYERFLTEKVQVARLDTEEPMLNFHTFQALDLICPEVARRYLLTQNLISSVSNRDKILEMGILCVNSDSTFYFIHKSFAEFFVGRFFDEFWSGLEAFPDSLVLTAGQYFYENALVISEESILDVNCIQSGQILQSSSEKTISFALGSTLWFLNNISSNDGQRQRFGIAGCRFEAILDPAERHICKNLLIERCYAAILACIDSGFSKLLSMIFDFIKPFVDGNDTQSLLIKSSAFCTTEYKNDPYFWVHYLLQRICVKENPEAVTKLFDLYRPDEDNIILKCCKHFPAKLVTPSEIAVVKNNLDMFEYFFPIVAVPMERLLLACMHGEKMTTEQIHSRTAIFQRIISSTEERICTAGRNEFRDYLSSLSTDNSTNLRLMRQFAAQYNVSLYHLARTTKQVLLSLALCDDNDEDLIRLLVLLFKNPSTNIPDDSNTATAQACADYTTSMLLDLVEVTETLRDFKLTGLDVFKNLMNPQILEVLFQLWSHFSTCCTSMRNYLHYFVMHGRIDFVRHLIQAGYDVNQKDKDGCTPLQYISSNHTLEITRLLVENHANVYAINNAGENIAHRLPRQCNDPGIIFQWTAFMLSKGLQKLWLGEDNPERH